MGAVLFNFKSQFAELVASGRKRQTVRAPRQVRPKVGDIARCYTGLRTASTRLLASAAIVEVSDIEINFRSTAIKIDGRRLSAIEAERFARDDGFESLDQFLHFFIASSPLGDPHGFSGILTRWERPTPAADTAGALSSSGRL